MKYFIVLITMCAALEVFAHGGDSDDGPSALEEEFSRLSHVHLPVSYSNEGGLSFGYEIGEHEHEHSHDDADTDSSEGTVHVHEDGASHVHHHEDSSGTDDSDHAHADDSGIELNIHPTITGGFDKIRRLVNLDVSKEEGTSLVPASAEGKYLLLENRKWDLGLGIGGDTHMPNPLWALGLNISLVKGKNYCSFKVLNNKNENRPVLALPVTKEALQNWRPGDVLSFASRSSIIGSLGVGIDPIMDIGPSYAKTGIFRVKSSMKEDNKLEVEVLTLKTHSFSVEGDSIVVGGSLDRTKGKTNSITYTFNVADEKVLKALEYLYQGRLDLVNQEMLSSNGRILAQSEANSLGHSVTGSFGLPVVYFNGIDRGIYRSEGPLIENHSPTETHKTLVTSTAEVRDRFTRGVLSKHKWENRSLVSTLITGDHNIISAVFSWSFGQDGMSGVTLKNKIVNLSQLFPAPWLKKIQVPASNLGYVKADFSVNFSGADVLELLNTKTMSEIKDTAMANLENDMKIKGVRSFCRIRAFNSCLALYKNFIQAKHEKMRTITAVINEAYKQNKRRVISDKLNELVKTMFRSRYMTEAYTHSREGLIMEMRFEGENIKRQKFTH